MVEDSQTQKRKRNDFKASITFNCRGLKEQMSIWESGRFVCVRQDAMPFLIIKILIFKKIRNKQPFANGTGMIIIIKKLIENSYRPFFLHPGNTAEVGRGGGVSRRKSAASLSGKTTLCIVSGWWVTARSYQ